MSGRLLSVAILTVALVLRPVNVGPHHAPSVVHIAVVPFTTSTR